MVIPMSPPRAFVHAQTTSPRAAPAGESVITHRDRSSESPPTRHIASPTSGLSDEAIARLFTNGRLLRQSEHAAEVTFNRGELSPVPHNRIHPPENARPSPPHELENYNPQRDRIAESVQTTPARTTYGPVQSNSNDSGPTTSTFRFLNTPLDERTRVPVATPSYPDQAPASRRSSTETELAPASRRSSNETELASDDGVRASGSQFAVPTSNVRHTSLATDPEPGDLNTRIRRLDDPPVHFQAFEADRHVVQGAPVAPQAAQLQQPPVAQQSYQAHAASTIFQSSTAEQPTGYIPPAVPSLAPGPIFQSSRGKKPHVSVACNNCKAAHLACDDSGFPCQRCRATGKTDCQPVVHRQRGRPPRRTIDPEPVPARPLPATKLYRNEPLPQVIMDIDLRILRLSPESRRFIPDEDTIRRGDFLFESCPVLPFAVARECRQALERAINESFPGYRAPPQREMFRVADGIDFEDIMRVAPDFERTLNLSFMGDDVGSPDLVGQGQLRLGLQGSVLFTYLIVNKILGVEPTPVAMPGPLKDARAHTESALPPVRTHGHRYGHEDDRYPAAIEESPARFRPGHRDRTDERAEAQYGGPVNTSREAQDVSRTEQSARDGLPGPESLRRIAQRFQSQYRAANGYTSSRPAPEQSTARQSDSSSQRGLSQYRGDHEENGSASSMSQPYGSLSHNQGVTATSAQAARVSQSSLTMPPPPFMEPPLHTWPSMPSIDTFSSRTNTRISTDWASSSRRRDTLGDKFNDSPAEPPYRASHVDTIARAAGRFHRPQFQQPNYASPRSQYAHLANDVPRSPRRQSGGSALVGTRQPEEHAWRGVETRGRGLDVDDAGTEYEYERDMKRQRLGDGRWVM